MVEANNNASTRSVQTPAVAGPFIHEYDLDAAFDYSSSLLESSANSSSDEDTSTESTIPSCSLNSGSDEERHPDGVPSQLEFTEEDIAMVTQFMTSPGIGNVMGGLIERGGIMTSINWVSAHVPTCVLDHLGDEVRAGNEFRKVSADEAASAACFSGASAGSDGDGSIVSELSDREFPLSGGDQSDGVDAAAQKSLHLEVSYRSGQIPNGDGIGVSHRDSKSALEHQRSLQSSLPGTFHSNGINFQRKAALGVDQSDLKPRPRATDEPAPYNHDEFNGGSTPPVRTIRRLSTVSERSQNSSQRSRSSNGPEDIRAHQHAQRLIHNSKQMRIGEGNGIEEEVPRHTHKLVLEHRLALQAFGFGGAHNSTRNVIPNSTHKVLAFRDPFPDDSDEEISKEATTLQVLSRRPLNTISRRENRRTTEVGQYLSLPHSSAHQAALLFVDISGFTKLATSLDPEHLSKAINSYFQMIVNEVTSHGGDILKFAGDGVFVEWKAKAPNSSPTLMGRKKLSLTQCVCTAATCAAKIVAKCSDFPIFAHHALGSTSNGQGAKVATLNVHCGLGVGQIIGVHVGDYESRREFVILGDPIDQVCAAVNAATLGEAAVSPQALVTLTKCCIVDEGVHSAPAGKPVVIARRAICRFTPKGGVLSEIDQGASPRALSQIIESWHIDSLKQYKQLMSLYVHPVVVANDTSNRNRPRSNSTVQERHREEAELRSVFVLFVTPLISVRVSGNKEADKHLYKLLNNIMNLTTRELTRFSGHLRQFIVDDKGVVLIATFGLRGSTFPNMVAERALPATITLHNALRNELGVQNQVGATIGNTYCGVVGGIKRHEYAVMGPSVNLAARLMSSPKNPGILVDNAVRTMADRSYAFNALPPVKAKGYSEPVPIFEPLSPLERSWGRVQPNFVGRKTEIMSLMATAREIALTQCSSKIVYIAGESGMGKSTVVVHAIEHIRKLMGASQRCVIVTKHVSKESDLLVPFGIFRSILVNVLSYFKSSQDDKSYVSYSSSHGLGSIGWESLSGCSFSVSEATGLTRSADRLSSICRELSAPPAFEELVGHHLLGVENKSRESYKNRGKGSNMKSLVSFMAKAFKRCTQEASLVIVALDDVHHVDEMSWRVVQELFETVGNVLFLCTSRPLSTYRLLVDATFWEDLTIGSYHEEGRFQMITLDRLAEIHIKAMIAKTLGLQEREVSSTLLNDVMMQSNGMPHFANEILETMKRKKGADGRMTDESEGDIAYGSVGELLLHRIDSFDASVRNILNLGAVLGSSFEMKEIVGVLRQIIGKEETDRKSFLRTAKDALDVAVSEGILFVVHEGGDFIDDGDDGLLLEESPAFHESLHSFRSSSLMATLADSLSPHLVYTFCHDVWRKTILNLMLDSRKRDMHKIIARTLEKQEGRNKDDYLSRMKLFSHWKASGESKKAASLALSIGTSFEELGLQDQSIKVFQDALDMWEVANVSGDYPIEVLDALSACDLECVINVYIALAKCLANIHKAAESLAAYQNALRIIQGSDALEALTDRSILFPIFSGLFVALKFGQIEQDEECTYEQSLVARFVYETRLHGDAVHYIRALAMQAEMYGRLGQYKKAIETHTRLVQVYDAEEHSKAISECYGSDRGAQSFGISARWQIEMDNEDKAMETCWYVINDLMPKMEPRNVHNSFMMIYSLLWILKDHGYALEARDNFIEIVVEAFDEYFGAGRSTSCLPVYDSIMMVLDLAGNPELEQFDDYVEWATNEDNLRYGTFINCALGNLGRCADSISAEICLLLAKCMEDCALKRQLIRSGLDVASEVLSLTEAKRMLIASRECQEIQAQLAEAAKELTMDI